MMALMRQDLSSDSFSKHNLRVPAEMYLKIKDNLHNVYPTLLQAYKIYLSRHNYPSSGVKKYIDFLIKIDLV